MIPHITELNNTNYQNTIDNNSIVLVDVYTNWCSPCKQLSPVIDEISYLYKDVITVGKIDAELNTDITTEIGIRNVPTILLYKNGEIIDRAYGFITKEKLSEFIDKNL